MADLSGTLETLNELERQTDACLDKLAKHQISNSLQGVSLWYELVKTLSEERRLTLQLLAEMNTQQPRFYYDVT